MMKDFLLTMWQLPQTLLAIVVIMCLFKNIHSVYTSDDKLVVTVDNFNSGVSLGDIIILDSHFKGVTYLHELGHSKQSKYLGPLYLLVIGLPSLIHNIVHRLSGRKWDYYSFYTEKWADKLMNIQR